MFQGVDNGNTNTIFQKIITTKIFHHNNFYIIVDSFDILTKYIGYISYISC